MEPDFICTRLDLHSVRVFEPVKGDRPRYIYTPGTLTDRLIVALQSDGTYSFTDFSGVVRQGQASSVAYHVPPTDPTLRTLSVEEFLRYGKPLFIEERRPGPRPSDFPASAF